MYSNSPLSLDAKPQSVKKFYFFDYFYVLLKSVQNYSDQDKVFDSFLNLKQIHQLGLSKYRTLAGDDNISARAIQRYRYTYHQVVSEAAEYELVRESGNRLELTELGSDGIDIYEKQGSLAFIEYLLQPMERRYRAFRHLLDVCYQANSSKHGLLVFPIYSPNKLGIDRQSIKTAGDLVGYCDQLRSQLERDVSKHLGFQRGLERDSRDLLERLREADLLPRHSTQPFDPQHYNAILKRIRDYWLKFFLQDLYHYQFSLATFDIWAYRAKQAGILQITEFYPDPGFGGRIVYPLSILNRSANPKKFRQLYAYEDGCKLFRHQPFWDDIETREEFVRALHQAYLDIRRSVRSRFVNLASVRERVCYAVKIAEFLFDDFLSRAYHERLKIRISMEVDKLPEETNAMYLKRAPVMVDGKYRNIIAIDLA